MSIKNLLFFTLLVAVIFWIYDRSTPISFDKKIKATLVFNKAPIQSIRQERTPTGTKELYVDSLNFPNGRIFQHKRLGPTPYSFNFFVDFKMQIDHALPGTYDFVIYSDDGFILLIDGKEICSFEKDRAFAKTDCVADLSEGAHTLDIHYFQGGGGIGIVGYYRHRPTGGHKILGESSRALSFAKLTP